MVESEGNLPADCSTQIELQSRERVSPSDLVLFEPFGLDFFIFLSTDPCLVWIAEQVLFVLFWASSFRKGGG